MIVYEVKVEGIKEPYYEKNLLIIEAEIRGDILNNPEKYKKYKKVKFYFIRFISRLAKKK